MSLMPNRYDTDLMEKSINNQNNKNNYGSAKKNGMIAENATIEELYAELDKDLDKKYGNNRVSGVTFAEGAISYEDLINGGSNNNNLGLNDNLTIHNNEISKQDKNGNSRVTFAEGTMSNNNLFDSLTIDSNLTEKNAEAYYNALNKKTSGGIKIDYTNITVPLKIRPDDDYFTESDSLTNEKSDDIPTKSDTPEVTSISYNEAQDSHIKDYLEQLSQVNNYITNDLNTFKNGMRVSLNIVPINRYVQSGGLTQSEFSNRMGYILGDSTSFLYQLFGSTKGLVFPYTPDIKMNSSVSYEEVEILHSNLNYNFYKNTPPPGINITADFTADTPENALYMLGAIWFFRALSKVDFGKESKYPGMPPPILYLNGYGKIYDNIPVVITGFNMDFDKNKHYVDLKMTDNMFSDFKSKIQSTSDKKVYENIRNLLTDQWLPTDLTMNLQFKILPNMRKVKEKFNLDKFKRGDLGNVYLTGGTNDEFNGHGWTW